MKLEQFDLYNDKKGLQLKLAFYAIIAIGMILLSVEMILTDWENTYGTDIPYDLGEYEKINEIYSYTSGYKGNMSVTDPGASTDFEGTTLRAVFGILNTIFAPFRLIFGENGMISSIVIRFRLPSWIYYSVVAMILASIIFTLIAIFFRLTRESA